MTASKPDRFAAFIRRLGEAPPARDSAEALELLGSALNATEAEMTDIPFNPETWQTDGRMYPPQLDSARKVSERPDVTRYRSRGHNTYIADNGTIEIVEVGGTVIFRKPGADGKHLWKK